MAIQKAFKALSDPTRREILSLLRHLGPLAAGDIAGRFPIAAPSVSHHLNVLKEADLVSVERQGQNLIYSLNTTVFQDLLTWTLEFTKQKGAQPKNEL